MKYAFLIPIFLFAHAATALASQQGQARVTNVICGEIDPIQFGDVCAVFLETADQRSIALIADYEASMDVDLESQILGKDIDLSTLPAKPIQDEASVQLLKSVFNNDEFYAATPVEILNSQL